MGKTKAKSKGVGGNGNLIPPVKGERRNPDGRPKGQRNYATIYREALRKIGEAQNMTPEEVEDILHQSGLKNALKGNYKFYQDTLDRLHGKPVQENKTDLTSGGEKIDGFVVEFVESKKDV
jgi:hypothetical protein